MKQIVRGLYGLISGFCSVFEVFPAVRAGYDIVQPVLPLFYPCPIVFSNDVWGVAEKGGNIVNLHAKVWRN
jgi:hypothetical protein